MFEQFTQEGKQRVLRHLPLVFISLGIALRIFQYIPDISLWLDESCLSLNIVNRSYSELLEPLDKQQAAPVGFLFIEKLMVQLLGSNEYALRLFPFICGIISIFLFYSVAKHFINKDGAIIALGLFALSPTLINYSANVKQYSSDVAVGLLLYVSTVYFLSHRSKSSHTAFFGIVGAAAVWISHPSIFILAGIGVTLAVFYLVKKEWTETGRLLVVCSIWLLSFIVYYSVSLVHSSTVIENMQRDWSLSFMPLPPFSLRDFKWFFTAFLHIFQKPGGFLFMYGIAAFAFLIGSVSMFLRSRQGFFVLMSPVLITLLASGFHLYPFWGRLLLFIVPSVLILVAEGAGHLREKISPGSAIIGVIFTGLLFAYPVFSAGRNLVTHDVYRILPVEDIKPVMRHVKENKRDGDILYIYRHSRCAFKYYAERFGFASDEYIEGVSSEYGDGVYIQEINRLRGNSRVWLVFSHIGRKGAKERNLYLYYLDSIGKKTKYFKSDGAEVYLYDLS